MQIKKLAALLAAASLATVMLTGCPWDEDDKTDDAASSTPGSSSRPHYDGSEDDDDNAGNTGNTGGGTDSGGDHEDDDPTQGSDPEAPKIALGETGGKLIITGTGENAPVTADMVKTYKTDPDVTEIQATGVDIAPGAFADWTNLKVVTLNDVTKPSTIGDGAFKGCTGLIGADIRGVTSIGKEAFSGCSFNWLRVETIFRADENAFQGIKIRIHYSGTENSDFEAAVRDALQGTGFITPLFFESDTNDRDWADYIGSKPGDVSPDARTSAAFTPAPDHAIARFILGL